MLIPRARNGLLALFALASLTACNEARVVTETRTIEIPVRQYVPIPADLTAACPDIQKPAPACVDASGHRVLCNAQLIDWRDAEAAGRQDACDRLDRIQELQRKAVDPPGSGPGSGSDHSP